MGGDQEIIVKNFFYDGTAPKTFFTVGRHGDPEDPDAKRFIITEEGFEDNVLAPRFPVLEAANDETVTLSLRGSGLTVSDLKWISVWCFDFKVNFGDLELELEPENLLEIEEKINLFSVVDTEDEFEFDSAPDYHNDLEEEEDQEHEDDSNSIEELKPRVDSHSHAEPEPEAEAEFLIIPEPEAEYTVIIIPEPEPKRHHPRLKRNGHVHGKKGHHHRSKR